MKNFVVGFLSFFDNEILLEKISANNAVEAMLKHSSIKGYVFKENATIEEIQDEVFNSDAAISVIEI